LDDNQDELERSSCQDSKIDKCSLFRNYECAVLFLSIRSIPVAQLASVSTDVRICLLFASLCASPLAMLLWQHPFSHAMVVRPVAFRRTNFFVVALQVLSFLQICKLSRFKDWHLVFIRNYENKPPF